MNKFKFIDLQQVIESNNDANDKIKSQIKHYIVDVNSDDLPESSRPKDKSGMLKGVFVPVEINT